MKTYSVYETIVQSRISEIIESSRHGEEMFFTNSKAAAGDILKYLSDEKILNFPSKEAVIVNY